MKKLTACAVSLLILLSVFSLFAVAAATPTYVMSNQCVNVNDEFTVDVAIADNPGIISLRLKINYDSSVLTLLSAEDAGLLNGFTNPPATICSPYTLRWADALADTANNANGKIVTLKFKATKANAITTVSVEHAEARNYNGSAITFANASASIIVVSDECRHSFTNFVPDNNANCHTGGTKTASCDHGCGETKTEITAPDPTKHDGATELRNVTSANCLQDGYTGDSYCCSCGALLEHGMRIPATGHSWVDGEIITEPTCGAEGLAESVCTTCGETETKRLHALEHNWGDLNQTTQQCTLCGSVKELPGGDDPEKPPEDDKDEIILGDVDNDGNITSGDARFVLRAVVGLETFSDAQIQAADINRDGTLSSSDARSILRASVGL